MKRWQRWMAVTTSIVGIGALGVPVAADATTSCAVSWGSRAKSAMVQGTSTSSSLVDVRGGRHACYDRLVLDLAGSGGARVRYVSAVPYQARGGSIPLRGGAFLEILTGPSYDASTGAGTYVPANDHELVDAAGWRTVRQVADGDSFEGQTTLGVGVRARLPFRVFGVAGPGHGSRLVIDVAHRW